MIFPDLFLTLDTYSSWRVGGGGGGGGGGVGGNSLSSPDYPPSLLRSDLVAELNQTVIEVQRTDSMMAE